MLAARESGVPLSGGAGAASVVNELTGTGSAETDGGDGIDVDGVAEGWDIVDNVGRAVDRAACIKRIASSSRGVSSCSLQKERGRHLSTSGSDPRRGRSEPGHGKLARLDGRLLAHWLGSEELRQSVQDRVLLHECMHQVDSLFAVSAQVSMSTYLAKRCC